MAEQIYKLSPDRDLQCYFYMPSAIAAMSGATPNGFTLSGTWRQQFDWAVVEWNRDNVFEHPAIRYLPDGDLSGLQLTYQETRTNCIPFESTLYPTVDWPSLRIWAGDGKVYYVSLMEHAVPVIGSYRAAQATMTLTGTVTGGHWICICMPTQSESGYPEQHCSYELLDTDTLASAAANLAKMITAQAQPWTATSNDASITLTWTGTAGSDGNRISVYGTAEAGATVSWVKPVAMLSGGVFPKTYQVTLNFASLMGYRQPASIPGQLKTQIPMSNVRKLRWTWAPDLQSGSFVRTAFNVSVTGWTVTGTGREYFVAGPGSRRIEDDDPSVVYSVGPWAVNGPDNYSGSTIRYATNMGASCSISYSETTAHQLYIGSRLLTSGAVAQVTIDGISVDPFQLTVPGEDVLVRLPLGSVPAGAHTVTFTHAGPSNQDVAYFDFLEIAYPSTNLPDFPTQPQLALGTDWDTYHSQSLPAERTAWMMQKLGFTGRVNHYAGALWFYDLVLPGHVYHSVTITFTDANPQAISYITLSIGPTGTTLIPLEHLNLPGDTPATIAQAFANLINNGFTQVWASANGSELTITQRALTPWDGQSDGAPQLSVTISASEGGSFSGSTSSGALSGGIPGTPYDATVNDYYAQLNSSLVSVNLGYWRTDFSATLNQAARDWSLAYFKALAGYGIDVVASFSTELKNADPNVDSGLAQRRSDGSPVIVATPAVMTNFSPTCTQFWTTIYLAVAGLQQAAGLTPYLQFGEVQWWYFPWNQNPDPTKETPVSMPFYDAYTTQQFQAKYGVAMQTIADENTDPSQYPNETAFLPGLIGAHTAAIRAALCAQFPNCRFEVLYPTDTNNTPLTQLVNYPENDWTPQNLTCLKTESFSFTSANNLDLAAYSTGVSAAKGFPNPRRSHLVGIGSAYTAWMKEVDMAQSLGMQPVVLFALDQYCLIGYPPPPFSKSTRTDRQG